ncbi:hypothetical protein M9Y10_040177 [Tritrichomonas musculus]|uniref:Uncharacterized protein n=1 Tax=Tritrichomonas musculus TaxID=1915356 RepID=A0ABR2GPW0_9EUKA
MNNRLLRIKGLLSKAQNQAKYFDKQYQDELSKEESQLFLRYQNKILNDGYQETTAENVLLDEYSRKISQLKSEYYHRKSNKIKEEHQKKAEQINEHYEAIHQHRRDQRNEKSEIYYKQREINYTLSEKHQKKSIELKEQLQTICRSRDPTSFPPLLQLIKEWEDEINNEPDFDTKVTFKNIAEHLKNECTFAYNKISNFCSNTDECRKRKELYYQKLELDSKAKEEELEKKRIHNYEMKRDIHHMIKRQKEVDLGLKEQQHKKIRREEREQRERRYQEEIKNREEKEKRKEMDDQKEFKTFVSISYEDYRRLKRCEREVEKLKKSLDQRDDEINSLKKIVESQKDELKKLENDTNSNHSNDNDYGFKNSDEDSKDEKSDEDFEDEKPDEDSKDEKADEDFEDEKVEEDSKDEKVEED